ncbi:MAG: hypothetical protein R3B60_04020 [Candidatus Paceibacterota bacterium]
MDDNQNFPQQESTNKDLFRVTTVSKLLAFILFITLPFIGFWAGVKYSPLAQEVVQESNQDEVKMVQNEPVGEINNTDSCASLYREYRPEPIYDITPYSVVYSDNEGINYASDGKNLYPYSEKCKVSLIKTTKNSEVENTEVIVDDLVSLMLEQGVGGSLYGLPKPYIFYSHTGYPYDMSQEEKLFFGYNNYEGSSMAIYKLDLDTKTFKDMTGHIGNGQVDFVDTGRLLIPKDGSVLRVLDLNTEKLYETKLLLASGESFYRECGMGCASAVGWVDDYVNIWYGVYKNDPTASSYDNFIRIGHVKFDPNTWQEVILSE